MKNLQTKPEKPLTPRVRFCWRCSRKLQTIKGGFAFESITIDGNEHVFHITCAKEEKEERGL